MSDTPIGDAAREATASPYIGKRRKAPAEPVRFAICECGWGWIFYANGDAYGPLWARGPAMDTFVTQGDGPRRLTPARFSDDYDCAAYLEEHCK